MNDSRWLRQSAHTALLRSALALLLGALAGSGCREAPRPAETPAASGALDGERLYFVNCGRCHLRDGEGVAGMAPAMADSSSVSAEDPRELIRVVLDGQGGKAIRGQHYPSRMPGFRELLKDEEVAEIVNYTRVKWGGRDSRITPGDVNKERDQP